ncbi:Integral membrane protein-like protein [Verrucomicrobia bacterium]|nr:Integral membrane protein-like protein [Verrucomicrobiota bacterium]
MPLFAVTVFFSAFLLFAVQPMMAKFLLPSFGGTAAVWATCLVMFQTLLLAGYAYAHLLRAKLSPPAQRWIHLGVLSVSLFFLPPSPPAGLTANLAGAPTWTLLRCLFSSVAVPFFALSATAPLLMEWFRQAAPGRAPDRLYAFSNAGSLLALLGYPVVLEPSFSRTMQARLWSAGLGLFVALCAAVAWRSARGALKVEERGEQKSNNKNAKPLPASAVAPAWLWIGLPACGSAMLLALTNQLSQDVAPMPLLWVAPMSVYLLTFILCFEGPRSYRRGLFMPLCFFALLLLAWLLAVGYLQALWVQVGGYLLVLFAACMVCHGELYRLRPPPERLTAFYLCISLGGALGGVFVALVAPALFKTLLETPIVALAVAGLVTYLLWREEGGGYRTDRTDLTDRTDRTDRKRRRAAAAARSRSPKPARLAFVATLVITVSLGYVLYDLRSGSIHFSRSFYGAYRVKGGPTMLLDKVVYTLTPGPARILLSGQTYHGLQFREGAAARMPTTYYCEEGGLGLALRELPVATNRNIGVIGLGAGTIAAYGKPGDRFRFYELDPEVLHLAQTYFTFLTNCPVKVEVALGDGRLSLEREPAQGFDLLVLDAFAGDSIPIHLLTDEAMRIYMRHLKPEGVMAFHISNNHLDLEPVVRGLADKYGLSAVLAPARFQEPRQGKLASVWMLVSSNRTFLDRPAIAGLARAYLGQPLLWTDDYSSILPILH